MNSGSNHIPREVVDEIREQSDIVEVISESGVPLKPAGKDYNARCPFHDEKTPSFSVSPQKQMFYCFGCQTGGNVISFVQKYEGKTFVETVEWLADRLGMVLPNQDPQANQISRKRVELQDLNRFAADYFHKQLLNPSVGGRSIAYLKNRGVKDETIRKFQLGYTTSGRRNLVKAATQDGFSIQQLEDTGLIKNDEQGPVDRFRGRVIFPICDERGVPVGFGGRAVAVDLLPKYLNSPATTLYDKSKVLYNLCHARSKIQKTGTAILVEGYLDALMLHQAGVENVVASLGTSLSESHASLLKRFAEEVVIVYDGDSAGSQATLRGLRLLVKESIRVRIAMLPSDEDPDSFVRARGIDGFNEEVVKAINLIEFQIQRAVRQDVLRRVDVKSQAVKDIAQTLSNVRSEVEVAEYVKYAAQELDIDPPVLWSELRHLGVGVKGNRSVRSVQNPAISPTKEFLSPRESVEEQLVETLIQCPDFIPYVKEQLHYQDFTRPEFVKVIQMLWAESNGGVSIDIQNLINTCPDEKVKGIISNAVLGRTVPPNLNARVEGCLKKLKHFLLLDIERTIRSTALTQGNDNIDALEELIELSDRRRKSVP